MDNNYQPQYQTPQPQPQYNQNSYNGGQGNYQGGFQNQPGMGTPPNNYLIFAIFTTICCCLPTGIYAIIRATKVNTYFAMGQYDMARQASEDAKRWSIIGLIIGVVCNILGFALGLFSSIMQDM